MTALRKKNRLAVITPPQTRRKKGTPRTLLTLDMRPVLEVLHRHPVLLSIVMGRRDDWEHMHSSIVSTLILASAAVAALSSLLVLRQKRARTRDSRLAKSLLIALQSERI